MRVYKKDLLNKVDEIKRIAETLKKVHLMFDENGKRKTG